MGAFNKTITRFILSTSFICTLTVAILLSLPSSIWADWRPATCMPSGCFCEAISASLPIRQMSNTWSSLGYVVVGCLILSLTSQALPNRRRLSGFYTGIFGLSAIVIGVGSAFFHASLSFVGQFFDVFGMYLLTTFMLVYAWERLANWSSGVTILMFTGIVSGLSAILIILPDTRRYVFAIVLVLALMCEFLLQSLKKIKVQTHWLYIGLITFAIAYLIWILDNSHILCAPQYWIQGHALWHLLGAGAVGFLYRYYGSEF